MTDKEKAILWLKSFVKNKEPMTLIPKQLIRLMYDALEEQPEVIRCKDCKHRPKEPDWETYENGDIEFPEGSKCPCHCSGDEWYSWYPDDDWFCANAERSGT